MFQSLRWRLLLSYLAVMAAILSAFGAGVYIFFSRSLYTELDKKLLTLAQSAAPSMAEVKEEGSAYLEQVDEVPWRDIFNRDQQSLEWFDADGALLANRGALSPGFQPKPGARIQWQGEEPWPMRTYTISIYSDRPAPNPPSPPSLEGFIRATQSTEAIAIAQRQLLWGLGMGGAMALGLVGAGGLWLTQRALKPVEQSFNQLQQFTADASHELRSPITAVKTSVEVMRNHPERIHPKDIKKLAAIASATTQMSRLVEDLLFLARSGGESNAMPTRDWEVVCLNKALQDLIELLDPTAHSQGLTLEAHWLAQVSVMGDPFQLTRLFSNLLGNAFQYTPSGGNVTIEVDKRHRFAIISIKDTGIGIAPEHLSQVFDRFWRADKARSHQKGGMGLGLSIVQAIVEQHNGKITVNSQVGVGSCFQVHLPAIA
ncbi:MAG: HAMP domain-containing sensor histidine kinase [Leptolyngbyaceae cyanobacterium MO_188.B28]|nr:HAMP domain-containing sensor histidine kinase [Leptolyngbyaceae cyanobacterium MO_188.B28]